MLKGWNKIAHAQVEAKTLANFQNTNFTAKRGNIIILEK